MIGQKLSHFKITAKLGEGGMGEVYLAEDSTLGREVALKLLPSELAGSQQRLERFQREARALAALDHPNIVHIYSVEEAEGVHFLTMQLVRGEQLSDLIPARGMTLREFFAVAEPLADALATAHEQGITHRDLKPGNIMVDDNARVKVLDFGLAKLRDPEPGVEASELPTEAITEEGLIVGTVPYMSPEQAEGKEVDHRSDIFSLGIVLYQMATGRAPFQGDTPLSVLSSIVKDTPDAVEQVNSGVPRHLGRIIRKCLEKDPGRRYQSTRDLYNDLVDLSGEVESGDVEPIGAQAAPASRPQWPLYLLAAVGLGMLAVVLWRWTGERPDEAVEWNTRRLTSLPGVQTQPSLSPDGRDFAFVDYGSLSDPLRGRADSDIYVQRVGGARPINLTADWGGNNVHPAFSPDGEKIAFRSDREGGGLFVMGATGENPRKLLDEGFNPAWSPDGGSITYSTSPVYWPASGFGTDGLATLDLDTGSTLRLTEEGRQPAWSPSGRRIAYFTVHRGGQRDIATIDAEGGEPVLVTDDVYLDWTPIWAPDGRHLYFASNRGGAHNIWQVAIDEETGVVLGEPESVTRGGTGMQGFLSMAADGRSIVHSTVQATRNIHRVAFDPVTLTVGGPVEPVTDGPRSFMIFGLSPDGESIAAHLGSPWNDIVVMDVDGSGERKLTDDPYNDRRPRFSPDGESIYFYSARDGGSHIWSIAPDGTGLERVTDGDGWFMFSDPSPDGSMMSTNRPDGAQLFSLAQPYSQQEPQVFPADESGSRFAPYEWTADSRSLLGGLFGGSRQNADWALYDLEERTYRVLEGAETLEAMTFLGIEGLYLGVQDHSVMLYDQNSGETRELFSVAPDSPDWIRMSPDGKTIYFVHASAAADIHLLEVDD